jgi:hypothetical protein
MTSVGIHVSKTSLFDIKRDSMLEAMYDDCKSYDLSACQIFIQGPQSSVMGKMDYDKIAEYCNEKDIKLYVHSSYITVGIFNITEDNKDDTKSIKAIENLVKQFEACDKLNAHGLVIHLNKISPEDLIDNLKIYVNHLYKFNTPLILEQPAKKPEGYLTYETPAKINNLTKMINRTFPKLKWGWCIDTCHLWSGGINLSDVDITTKWFADLKYPETIKLFHINGGNNSIFKTGKDYHIVPFSKEDDIWSNKASYKIISDFMKEYDCCAILEIKRGELKDIKFAINYVKK